MKFMTQEEVSRVVELSKLSGKEVLEALHESGELNLGYKQNLFREARQKGTMSSLEAFQYANGMLTQEEVSRIAELSKKTGLEVLEELQKTGEINLRASKEIEIVPANEIYEILSKVTEVAGIPTEKIIHQELLQKLDEYIEVTTAIKNQKKSNE